MQPPVWLSKLVQQLSKKNICVGNEEIGNEKETHFIKSLLCPIPYTWHFTHISSFSTPNSSKCHLTPFTGDKLRLTGVKWLPRVT